MPQDTIPESDALDPDDTGSYATERERRRAFRADVQNQLRTSQIRMIVAVVLAVLGTGAGGLGTSLVTQRATEARMEERATQLERRMAGVEAQLVGIGALQRDVAALSAKVDAWRQSDSAASTAERQAIQDRLQRIEDRLYRGR